MTSADPRMNLRTPMMSMGTKCEAMVDTGRSVNYACTLPRGHAESEPHYAIESAKSLRLWQAWRSTQVLAEEARKPVEKVHVSAVEKTVTKPAPPELEPAILEAGGLRVVDLSKDGLLWLVNAQVFHPRGYSLGLTDGGNFVLQGDGSTPWAPVALKIAAKKLAAVKTVMP